MMLRRLKSRNYQLLLLTIVLMSVLGIRLFTLTVVEGKEWDKAATENSVRSIYTSAPRGEILDRYGRVLAGNMPSFTAQINAEGLTDEQINQVALNLIRILEANGDKYNDKFPI